MVPGLQASVDYYSIKIYNLISNLTGHPSVVVPNGFSKTGTPTSICFLGKLFGEAELLAVAKKYQDATDWHRKHPVMGDW